jgi:hypothetical protein
METIEKIESEKQVRLGDISDLGGAQVMVKKTLPNGQEVTTDWKEVVKKKWYESKTIIFNVGFAVFTGLGSLINDSSFQQMVGEYFSYLLTIVTIVNVYLRTITKDAIDSFQGR